MEEGTERTVSFWMEGWIDEWREGRKEGWVR